MNNWIDQAVDKIIKDIQGRSGIGNEWDEIDDEIREQIREEWVEIIRQAHNK